ncbi:hypothetical protein C2S52_007520 [Perilla frutescens var. hirtella]|nr:hypothetical protein C2S52_007520 [Perilla frutescens var. hirtella]
MVRRRIIVRHSGRWVRSEYVDGDEQLLVMSSDNLCFSALEKEVHKLLRTEPSTVELEFSYLTSTNTRRMIRASLRDDGDLLDLMHVISRYLNGSSVGTSVGTDYINPIDIDGFTNNGIRLMDSSSGNTNRLLGLTGAVASSSAGLGHAADIGQMWRIYKFNGTHTCHLDMSRVAPCQVLARVLAKYFARKLVDERTVLKPKEMIVELVREFGIHIDYSFALRTRNISIEMVYGDCDKSYAQLSAFLHTLQLMNPGTLVDLHVTSDYTFKHMFLALGACVRAFLQFAHPVLVVDGTHLKGKNKGVLFVAVTKDDDLLIVSDQHQSIKNAVASVFSRAAHGLCYYHLKNKMTKRGKNVLALFEDATYRYRTDIFQANMSTLEQCPVRRYGFMTSNAAESLNARLLWARRLPVCSLLEVYRSIVERWYVERRAAAHGANHVLTRAAVEKLSGSVEQGRRYAVRPTTISYLWKVELDLIPCSHAAAAICAFGGLIYDYVGSCYKVESLIGMYSEVIQGLPRPEEWIIPDAYRDRVVIPPDIRRRAGRPPLSRARAPFEASSSARR